MSIFRERIHYLLLLMGAVVFLGFGIWLKFCGSGETTQAIVESGVSREKDVDRRDGLSEISGGMVAKGETRSQGSGEWRVHVKRSRDRAIGQQALEATLAMSRERARQVAESAKAGSSSDSEKSHAGNHDLASGKPAGVPAKPQEDSGNAGAERAVKAADVKVEDEGDAARPDPRRILLAQAIRSALSTAQPWKELTAISLVQWDTGDEAGARQTLAAAIRVAPNPVDEDQSGEGLVSITAAQIRMGDLTGALDTAYTIKSPTHQNQALKILIIAHALRGEFVEAKVLVSSISDAEQRAESLRSIAVSQAGRGGGQSALATVSLITDLDLKNDALQRVAVTQAKLGQWQAAYGTAGLINDARFGQEAAYRVLCERIGQGDLDIARQDVWMLRETNLRDLAMVALARAYAENGQFDQAGRMVAMIAGDRERDEACARIALVEAREGNVNSAMNRFQMIDDRAWREEALKGIALSAASRNGIRAGRDVVTWEPSIDLKDKVLRELVKFEAGRGNWNSAQDCLFDMSGMESRLWAKLELALGGIGNGFVRQAQHELEEVSSRLSSLPDGNADKQSLRVGMARAWAKLNQLDLALGELADVLDASQRDDVLSQLSVERAESRDVASAQLLAQRIISKKIKENALNRIAQSHARNVDLELAEGESRKFLNNLQRSLFIRTVVARYKSP